MIKTVTLFCIGFLLCSSFIFPDNGSSVKIGNINLHYEKQDIPYALEYAQYITNGAATVNQFFEEDFASPFDIFIFPDRKTLDSTWQHDWGAPDFNSECWMVAAGVATRIDILSPATWDSTACEHTSGNTADIQLVITHEMVHTFHGQHNPSPDFSNVSGIDWLVEGLAVYASGQYDAQRKSEVAKAIQENKIPAHLADFWTGKLRYGISGSVIAFIDAQYGRNKLMELLPCTTLDQVLKILNTTENDLIANWKNSFR